MPISFNSSLLICSFPHLLISSRIGTNVIPSSVKEYLAYDTHHSSLLQDKIPTGFIYIMNVTI
ncbi:TPA: hypothetical protein PL619_000519 [Clostridium botulinum]|nr:hypothetical protein [Clostridium botulinum]HDI3122812.1 hypothetical protein [Clostridium botulinum]